jgi:hypothetical protein
VAINRVRGFRRIGWVLAFPLAAFVVGLFYGQTKEIFRYDWKQVDRDAFAWEKVVETPKFGGKAYFPVGTKEEVIRQVTSDIEKEEPAKLFARPAVGEFGAFWGSYEIIPQTKVNALKLAGLILASVACVGLIIQGSISILAWVFKGFKA